MCGRFTSLTPPGALAEMFECEVISEVETEEFNPNYNVAPSTRIFVIASSRTHGRRLGRMQWGLVPHWAKVPIGTGQINARSETLDQKPTFRDSYRKWRCIIPMTGYYEWRTIHSDEVIGSGRDDPKKSKQAVYVTRTDGQPFAVAGLWSIWTNPDSEMGERKDQRRTCCLVTRNANSLLASVHDRMPVILEKENWPLWLGEKTEDEGEGLQALLESDSDSMDLQFVDVGSLVNSVRNTGPELIVAVR
jgi:putative SOS response-associated peptidase YedK